MFYTHGGDNPKPESAGSDPIGTGNIWTAPPYPSTPIDPYCTDPNWWNTTILYAYTSQPINNTIKDNIRAIVRRMNGRLNGEAINAGGPGSRYRMRCNAQGQLAVWQYHATNSDFVGNIWLANAAGYYDNITKWLIFIQAPEPTGNFCGMASTTPDDSKWIYNLNNAGGQAPDDAYAIVWAGGCWTGGEADTPIHEAAHMMGAVAYSAPYSTGAYHCTVDADTMCYDDGGSYQFPRTVNCPNWTRYDCMKDMYFDPYPNTWNYLYSHWNIGQYENFYLVRP